MPDPSKGPCPKCGKVVKITQAGGYWRHKCEPGPQQQSLPVGNQSVTPEMVISKYIETRDEISQHKKEYEQKVAALKDLQSKREKFLQGMMQKLDVEKLGGESGTVFFDWKDSAVVADREHFLEWVVGDWTQRKHFLESRVSKSAVKQGHEDGKSSPPGVNYTRVKGIKIRRS